MKKQIRCLMVSERISPDWIAIVLSWWTGIELVAVSNGGSAGGWWLYEFACDWDLDFSSFKIELQ